MAKVLLIENQFIQFLSFSKMLREQGGHEVFPSEKEYKLIIDYVRIVLNPLYPASPIKRASVLFCNYVRDNHIEFLIIDHKLVGHTSAKNGIHLAEFLLEEFKNEQKFKNLPIIFLSRTPRNEQEVLDRVEKLKENGCVCDWVEKGYAGMSIFDKDYFKKYVSDKINELSNKENYHAISSMLSTVIDSPGAFWDHLGTLQEIAEDGKKNKFFTKAQIDLIKKIEKDRYTMEKSKIDNLFKEYIK